METATHDRQLPLPFWDLPSEGDLRTERITNREIADILYELSNLLRERGENAFRVRAYERGAETLRGLRRPVDEIVAEEGLSGLTRYPGIGRSLARSIEKISRNGRSALLDRLRTLNSPERLFATVPDIGPELAARIHRVLGIETLAELWAAADDGRLESVPGMGPKRLRAVRESLAGRFRRSIGENRAEERTTRNSPAVSELLDVDLQYRNASELGRLVKVAPRRFNPTGEAWLPVLHTSRHGRGYTAMYSNTAHAHELGMTRDWVIVTCDDPELQGRWTVITGQFGALRGRRIVRRREKECEEYYRGSGADERPARIENRS